MDKSLKMSTLDDVLRANVERTHDSLGWSLTWGPPDVSTNGMLAMVEAWNMGSGLFVVYIAGDSEKLFSGQLLSLPAQHPFPFYC